MPFISVNPHGAAGTQNDLELDDRYVESTAAGLLVGDLIQQHQPTKEANLATVTRKPRELCRHSPSEHLCDRNMGAATANDRITLYFILFI